MNDIFDMPDHWKVVGHDEIAGMPTENKGLIITGLGGCGNKFRYFITISARKNVVLKSSFKTKLKKDFNALFSQTKAKLEDVVVNPDHIRVLLLISMDYSVDAIVLPLIRKLNSSSNQFYKHYFVVNTNIPNDNEVQDYVDEIRNS